MVKTPSISAGKSVSAWMVLLFWFSGLKPIYSFANAVLWLRTFTSFQRDPDPAWFSTFSSVCWEWGVVSVCVPEQKIRFWYYSPVTFLTFRIKISLCCFNVNSQLSMLIMWSFLKPRNSGKIAHGYLPFLYFSPNLPHNLVPFLTHNIYKFSPIFVGCALLLANIRISPLPKTFK